MKIFLHSEKQFAKFFVMLIFVFNLTSYSQVKNEFDSLFTRLTLSKSYNSIKSRALLDQLLEIEDTSFINTNRKRVLTKVSSVESGKQTLENRQRLADLYLILGDLDTKTFNYLGSIDNLLKCEQIGKQLNDTSRLNQAWEYLGNSYNLLFNRPKALHYYYRALKLSTFLKDSVLIPRLLNNIAAIHFENGFYDKAETFYRKSQLIAHVRKEELNEAIIISNIAVLYMKQNKYKEALQLLKKSENIYRKYNDLKGHKVVLYNNIAVIHLIDANLSEAKKYYFKCLTYSDSLENVNENLAEPLRGLAEVFSRENNMAEAEKYGVRSLNCAKKNKDLRLIHLGAITLRNIYLKRNKYAEATRMYDLELLMKDSINNEKLRKESYRITLQHEYDIKFLTDSLKVQAEKKTVELELSREKSKNYILYLMFALALVILILIYTRYRLNQEKKELVIKSQTLVVNRQEKELIKTELDYLRAQINPHFFFNAINTIYFMIDKNDVKARNTLSKFADILRYQLYDCNRLVVSIDQEIKFLRDYADLQLLRKGDDFFCEINISDSVKGFNIAPLILVPFVENAFNYLSSKPSSIVEISINRVDSSFIFSIKNPKDKNPSFRTAGGIGIKNVKRRLELVYKNNHVLNIIEKEEEFEVYLEIII